MDYSYLDFSHLDSILEIERESNPFPWTERNFTDCLEKGYYSFYEPSLILEYHGFKYVNLGLGTGFRVTGHQESIYPKNLTTQTFIFRFGVKFSEIYQQLKELTDT